MTARAGKWSRATTVLPLSIVEEHFTVMKWFQFESVGFGLGVG